MLKYGKSTFIGLIAGVAFVVGAILLGEDPGLFWNPPSAFIIFGGTLAAVIMAFPPKELKRLLPVIKRAFKKDNFDIEKDILTLVTLAELARREGLLSLEEKVNDYTDDPFIKKGIQLIVDGADEDELVSSLEGASYFMKKRHKKGAAMVHMIAATSPSLGLVGTYVGLIPMLNNLDDPSILGPMMALELVSSFYGAFTSYVIFANIAKRLDIMSTEELDRRELLTEGLAAIQAGKNPRRIKENLSAYMNIDLVTPDKNKEEDNFVAREMGNQL